MEDLYSVEGAFKRIEDELISSMMRNLGRHLKEEDALGFDWAQWQALQLKYLQEYRKDNRKKYGPQFKEINKNVTKALHDAAAMGEKEEEKRIAEAAEKGAKLRKLPEQPTITGGEEFFRPNERKLNALVEATSNDLDKAERAVLRRSNDIYRKVIFDAQVYANTGAGTVQQAVDMATKDFLSKGIDCIVYKNGSRHTISDYADMCVRTAERRAYLTGEGKKRQEWGIPTVIVNKRGTMQGGDHGTACPHCIKWLGKVLIDDVWSGGEAWISGENRQRSKGAKPMGKSPVTGAKYPLMSTAIAEGLYHPRCKDGHTTYFEGISTPPEEATKADIKEAVEAEKEEAKQNYAERQAEKYDRLAEHSLDLENRRKYEARAEDWRAIARGYESGPVMSGLNSPGITQPEAIVDEFMSALELPEDTDVINCVKKSVRHMPKEDLDMIAEHGLIIRKTDGPCAFVRKGPIEGKDGRLKYVIEINPYTNEPFVFAHECAHFAEKVNNLFHDDEFVKVLENFWESIYAEARAIIDNDIYYVGVSELLIEPYQGRTYIKDLGVAGLEKIVEKTDFVEYISDGYECFVGDPELLAKKDPMLYNYFTRRGLR